jgi:hypothetical protein
MNHFYLTEEHLAKSKFMNFLGYSTSKLLPYIYKSNLFSFEDSWLQIYWELFRIANNSIHFLKLVKANIIITCKNSKGNKGSMFLIDLHFQSEYFLHF